MFDIYDRLVDEMFITKSPAAMTNCDPSSYIILLEAFFPVVL